MFLPSTDRREQQVRKKAPTDLADDGGVVAVPPAAVEVQVGELVGQHRRLVLRDARQKGGEELDLGVVLAEPPEVPHVGGHHAVLCVFNGLSGGRWWVGWLGLNEG